MSPRKQPLRVLYVSPHAELGGAERVTLDLVELHDRSAVEPAICFLRDGPLVTRCRDVLGVPTHLVPAPRLRRMVQARRAVRAIADLITAGGFDLVHSVMAWGHLFGGRAARSTRRPAVWYQHGAAAWSSGLEAAASLVAARAILANSAYTAAGQRRVNPRRARIEVVHPGTRVPEEERAIRRARGRVALGLLRGEYAVGVVARLMATKGQDVVIRAAASLLRARRHARLFIIGDALFGLDAAWAAGLPRLAETLGIKGRVAFTGFRDDVPDCLAALDVAVQAPLVPETFGLGMIEAMAAGTAIVTADSGAAREVVTHGVDGVLFPPGDDEALATTLLALCDDPERRAALAAAGEDTVRDRFDAAVVTRQVEALYRDLVA